MVYINSVKQLDVFPAFDAETKSFFLILILA